jgi:hypothetical protein
VFFIESDHHSLLPFSTRLSILTLREHPGYLGAQDTYYVGTIKSIGRIYQQTFIDTYTKVAFAKLYDRKTPWWPPTC